MPPLRALIAFEAAVRHVSFKLAARELHVSPGAVSQQVQKLEEWLGFLLFYREVRQLRVTERGLDYYARIASPLEQIRQESHASRVTPRRSVCLSLTPALAAKWLAPRMADFIAKHPDIDLRINSVSHPVDFVRESVDLAIRHFNGQDPALDATLLYAGSLRVLCSPDYRSRLNLRQPDDLARTVLIQVSQYASWDEWLQRFTLLDAGARKRIHSLHFDQLLLGIDAAKRSQGVVLGNRLVARDELEKGELIDLFDQGFEQSKAYFLVHPRQQPLSPEASMLKQWLVAQFDSTDHAG
ncbi:transcriptional regulator [Marinobacterium zhoushanense]|uniref:Transcriptional regulator n=1 Tax=Marinobacterium zhoushanense TaxID=1679163 RepID=A0ABQ1KVD8_9GAMM|nr:LysR substrate-binding domain-containing protein [Marinobacterium zhoushanense]GGC08855.1 transcriptional regulator [Marinobacterium zhoushanense]